MKLGNLRAHELQKTHQEITKQLEKRRSTAPTTSQASPSSTQPGSEGFRWRTVTVEDSEDEDFWQHRPSLPAEPPIEDVFPAPPPLSSAMRDALSGNVHFTAGPDDFMSTRDSNTITLEEVLSGAGLFDAFTTPGPDVSATEGPDWEPHEPAALDDDDQVQAGKLHHIYMDSGIDLDFHCWVSV